MTHENGLYLAFTNSVVDDLSRCGAISRTIDSLFISFLIPKFVSAIPIIGDGSKLDYLEITNATNPVLKNVGRIHIDRKGNICNGSRQLPVTLNTPNAELHRMAYFSNLPTLKAIFGKGQTKLTDHLRNDLMAYIINEYPNELINFIRTRFDYVIFDEAQDLGGSKEEFAKLLHGSDFDTIFLGDDDQKIMPASGSWFEGVDATERRIQSKRCPEDNCKWIRDNLDIEICGDKDKAGGVETVDLESVNTLDDGEKMLLYHSERGVVCELIGSWSGPKSTIGKIKGSTVDCDVVIVGASLNKRSYYVAVTRTTKKVFTAIKKINP